MKVFIGLSGGVDSAVSAALLKEQGHDITGVFIRIALPGYPCSAGEDKISAQRVAAHLGIPFKEIDLSKEYQDEVFAYTIAELAKGRTPNPDTMCNQKIKFGTFYEYARKNGADFVATGHYAQIKNGALYKGADENKDQSYFLWMVPKEVLAHTLFPIGHLHKPEVRKLAAEFNLPNASRHDSQGLCFLGDTTISDMIMRELTPMPGNVLNEGAEIVGKHSGVQLYTVGQRHGFELFAHTPETMPHFVIAKDTKANTITISPERFPRSTSKTNVELTESNWISPLLSGLYQARFRYRQKLIQAKVDIKNNVPAITLLEPHYVPLGQSLVLYQDGQCFGGGIVDNSTLA